eukprot:4123123-Pleurochrysis_carterae.AAC.1
MAAAAAMAAAAMAAAAMAAAAALAVAAMALLRGILQRGAHRVRGPRLHAEVAQPLVALLPAMRPVDPLLLRSGPVVAASDAARARRKSRQIRKMERRSRPPGWRQVQARAARHVKCARSTPLRT